MQPISAVLAKKLTSIPENRIQKDKCVPLQLSSTGNAFEMFFVVVVLSLNCEIFFKDSTFVFWNSVLPRDLADYKDVLHSCFLEEIIEKKNRTYALKK